MAGQGGLRGQADREALLPFVQFLFSPPESWLPTTYEAYREMHNPDDRKRTEGIAAGVRASLRSGVIVQNCIRHANSFYGLCMNPRAASLRDCELSRTDASF